MELNRSNLGFSQIRDALSSELLTKLADSGVLPKSFKVIKGYVNFSGDVDRQVAGIGYVRDSATKKPISLVKGSLLFFVKPHLFAPSGTLQTDRYLTLALSNEEEKKSSLDDTDLPPLMDSVSLDSVSDESPFAHYVDKTAYLTYFPEGQSDDGQGGTQPSGNAASIAVGYLEVFLIVA